MSEWSEAAAESVSPHLRVGAVLWNGFLASMGSIFSVQIRLWSPGICRRTRKEWRVRARRLCRVRLKDTKVLHWVVGWRPLFSIPGFFDSALSHPVTNISGVQDVEKGTRLETLFHTAETHDWRYVSHGRGKTRSHRVEDRTTVHAVHTAHGVPYNTAHPH